MSNGPAASEADRADAVGAVEDEVRALIHRVKRTIGAGARAVHEDLQGASYILLSWLASRPPVRPSAVVEALGTDKGALSRQLQHLVELGLVERRPDPDDGRASLVTVTEDAVRRLGRVDGERRRRACERLEGWSVEDLRDLADRLAAYNRALD
jgi:DNA-binding MarR family transcriptional regulator